MERELESLVRDQINQLFEEAILLAEEHGVDMFKTNVEESFLDLVKEKIITEVGEVL